jgi:cytochrome P450
MISLDPELYPSPNDFDGFRYYEKRKVASGDAAYKNQFTSTSPEQMHFGFGRQACPGRFFASAVIKAIVMHLLEEFDLLIRRRGGPRTRIKGE